MDAISIAKFIQFLKCYGNIYADSEFYKYSKEISTKCHNGRTPLHEAAYKGNLELCKLFMDKLEDKNPKDNTGKTPLHYIADVPTYKWDFQVHSVICKFIIQILSVAIILTVCGEGKKKTEINTDTTQSRDKRDILRIKRQESESSDR